MIDPRGTILDTYDKAHLVPFGEYLPHFSRRRSNRPGLRQFIQQPGGFEPGRAHGPSRAGPAAGRRARSATRRSFPVTSSARSAAGPADLNVTNDAWFGSRPGPTSISLQARLRAVEEGLPLVRAANTGISAVVDPYGRVLASLPARHEGVLDRACRLRDLVLSMRIR